eukprot:6207249-Pleurochrysis_carterae.AAC.1
MPPPHDLRNSHRCICGSVFATNSGLTSHCSRFCSKVGSAAAETFTLKTEEAESLKRAAAGASLASKRARGSLFADQLRYQLAMDLAQLRYVKLVPGAHVDIVKGYVNDWLLTAVDSIMSDLAVCVTSSCDGPLAQSILESATETIRSKLDLFNGLRTECAESQYLRSRIPMVTPVRRVMPAMPMAKVSKRQSTTTDIPIPPSRKPKDLVAYDFAMDELFA